MGLVGSRIGQYEITEQIGQGGMASVYKAYQDSLDRFVAIKVLAPNHAWTKGFKERFFREAKAVAQLSHPNILPIYDVGMEGDLSYIVMKYISERSMRDLLGSKMDLYRVCRYMVQISGALDHAHERGIIHRDIKSQNLLLEGDWVFLTDFGIAKILEASMALTSTGELMGTPCYMSPEQAAGKPVDHRTDIYSLGIVLYEMIAGTVPFKGETPYGVIYKHIHEPLPPPRSFRPDLPDAVEQVIVRALAKRPEERFEKASHLAEAFRQALGAPPDITLSLHRPSDTEETLPIAPLAEPAMSETTIGIVSPSESPTVQTAAPVIRDRRVLWGIGMGVLIAMAITLIFLLVRNNPVADRGTLGMAKQEREVPAARGAFVRAESVPSGAQVTVDGIFKGQTPLRIELPLGEHAIRMERSGHRSWEQTIKLDEAKEYPLTAELKAFGVVMVESRPAGATVYADGVAKGEAPARLELPLGTHVIQLSLKGYESWKDSIRVEESKQYPVVVELKPERQTASVEVVSIPAGAEVLLNGASKGKAPVRTDLELGTHSIRLSMPDFQDLDHTIQVKEPKDYQFALALTARPVVGAPAAESPVDEKAARIDSLLKKAQVAYEKKELIVPTARSAVQFYKEVFAIDATERSAYDGSIRVAEELLRQAGASLSAGKSAGAILRNIQYCLGVIPEPLKLQHREQIAALEDEIKSLSTQEAKLQEARKAAEAERKKVTSRPNRVVQGAAPQTPAGRPSRSEPTPSTGRPKLDTTGL